MTGITNKTNERPGPVVMVNYKINGLGPVPSFKNNKIIVGKGVKKSLITEPKRKRWMDAAILIVQAQNSHKPEHSRAWQKRDTPKGKNRIQDEWRKAVCVRVSLYISSLGSADPDGALGTIMDVLKKAGAIADDSPRYVRSTAVHWYECPKGQEGAQIAISMD